MPYLHISEKSSTFAGEKDKNSLRFEIEKSKDCAFIIEYIVVGRRIIREPADRAGEHQRAGAEYRHARDDR